MALLACRVCHPSELRSVGRGVCCDSDLSAGSPLGWIPEPAVSAARDRGPGEVRAGDRRALEAVYGGTPSQGL
jgi:hypothetical protein